MDAWSLLPPLLALLVVLFTREVISALALALLASETLQAFNTPDRAFWRGPEASINEILAVFSSAGNTRLLLFSLSVGALLALVRESGATKALVLRMTGSRFAATPARAGALTLGTSAALFIESNLSIFVSGLVSRDLFDRFRMSRARLAYLLHSFSPPICILILLNGWGAYLLGLLGNYEFEQSHVAVLAATIPLNFYALFTVAMVLFTVATGRVFGPMRQSEAEQHHTDASIDAIKPSKARYLLLPLMVLVGGMISFMFITGDGDFLAGDGSRSVLYAVMTAVAVAYSMLRIGGVFSHAEGMTHMFNGMKELLPLVAIMVFSIALGASMKTLGTGSYLAGMIGDWLPTVLVIPMLFLAGALVSFSTGTSWGTFAILIPIGVPLIHALGLPPSLALAAILGGGVFGDHCSPISDTTVVTSMASGCDLFEHVRTQLPYALFAALLAFVSYGIASWIMLP